MEIFIISICFINVEKKHHINKYFILNVTIVIQINKKKQKMNIKHC